MAHFLYFYCLIVGLFVSIMESEISKRGQYLPPSECSESYHNQKVPSFGLGTHRLKLEMVVFEQKN